MASPDQPTAPYLDAVIAYGFRGSTRFHVPGHKAGNGADLGVRTAIGWQTLKLDIPQDIHGVDLGPEPTPFQRAEQLAAEAYGAARSWFLTNGATQGNHALCLALAPLGAPVVVQRNAHASVIDGLVLSGGLPTWVAPEYEPELGMAHGVTPDSLRAALDGHAGRARRVHRLPHLLRHGRRRRGLRGGRARAPACRWWSTSPGARTSASTTTLPPSALLVRAPTRCSRRCTRSPARSRSRRCCTSPTPAAIDPDAVARTLRLVRSTSPSSLLMLSLDGARRQLVLHGEALLDGTIAASRRTATAINEIPGLPRRRRRADRPAGRRPPRPAAARHRRARDRRDRLRRWPPRCARTSTPRWSSPRRRRSCSCSASTSCRASSSASSTTWPRSSRGWSARARSRRSRWPRHVRERGRRRAARGVPRRVGRGRGRRSIGRVSAEAIAGYPPGIPVLLPGERITDEIIAYLRSLKAVGARLHGASDPDFQTIRVAGALRPSGP